jgi:nucleotide-binding universal stress UspA family protein
VTTPTDQPEPDPSADPAAAAVEIALDEAALLDGPLYEIHDPDTGRVLAVRDTLLAAHRAAEELAHELVELTYRQLAVNGEGHGEFWIRVHVRDQDTGENLGGVGIALAGERLR